MPVTSSALSPALSDRSQILTRLALVVAAVAIVAGAVALLLWLFVPVMPPPTRNPFGVGVREAAPSAGGLGGIILALQGQFYRSLQAAVAALKDNGGAIWSLMSIGFLYGVFHAAGPGHGKAVIAAYLVSDERALAKGFGMSLAAALVQASVAVALVGIIAALLHATAATMSQVTNMVEIVSFAAVAALGLVLVWRKAGKVLAAAALLRATAATMSQVTNMVEIVSFAAVAALGLVLVWRKAGKVLAAAAAHDRAHSRSHAHAHSHGHAHASHTCDHSCGHAHLPTPQEVNKARGWRDMAGVVFAAGIRPCAGAIVVLVFALSQGLFAAGVAAAFAMALGTALTTGLIAALAVFAKAIAMRLARGRGVHGARAIAGIELLAAAFVAVLGASLLAGLWVGSAAS